VIRRFRQRGIKVKLGLILGKDDCRFKHNGEAIEYAMAYFESSRWTAGVSVEWKDFYSVTYDKNREILTSQIKSDCEDAYEHYSMQYNKPSKCCNIF
jgi:hypothetical protein